MREYIAEDLYDECGSLVGVRDNGELIRCSNCLYSTCIEEDDDWWECEHDHRVNHGDGFCNWSEGRTDG